MTPTRGSRFKSVEIVRVNLQPDSSICSRKAQFAPQGAQFAVPNVYLQAFRVYLQAIVSICRQSRQFAVGCGGLQTN